MRQQNERKNKNVTNAQFDVILELIASKAEDKEQIGMTDKEFAEFVRSLKTKK